MQRCALHRTTMQAPPAAAAATAADLGTATRGEVPILHQSVNGRPLIYLDNAATSQKPRAVLAAMEEYYEGYNSNVHRGVHALSARATAEYEAAREKVARFIGAASPEEVSHRGQGIAVLAVQGLQEGRQLWSGTACCCRYGQLPPAGYFALLYLSTSTFPCPSSSAVQVVYTRNATEAINLVANTWGAAHLQEGDEVVLSVAEHHSNIVPWQLLAQRKGLVLKFVELTGSEEVDVEQLAALVGPRTRLISLVHVSNMLGCVLPVPKVVELARSVGAKLLLDCCQSGAWVEAVGPGWGAGGFEAAGLDAGVGIAGYSHAAAPLPQCPTCRWT